MRARWSDSLCIGFQTPEHMVRILSCGDLAVLPYERSLHSGSALLALSVGRPVLARTSAYFSDLQAIVGSDWLMRSDTKLDASVLSRGLDWAETSERAPNPDLTACSWPVAAADTLAFYKELLLSLKGRSEDMKLLPSRLETSLAPELEFLLWIARLGRRQDVPQEHFEALLHTGYITKTLVDPVTRRGYRRLAAHRRCRQEER